MESEARNEIEVLRLCPEQEEILNELACSFIKILLTPKECIRKSERDKAEIILTWGRRIIKFGSCLKFNQLGGIHCTESLYKHETTDFINGVSHFKEVDDCLVLGKYIIISCISNEQKSRMLSRVSRNIFHLSSEEEVASFLCEMWELRDKIPLTTEAIEELVRGFPFCVEEFLMGIVEKVIFENISDNVDVIINSDLASFCELCAKSSKIFQTVLTILHEFLLVLDVHECLFYFINRFFHSVEHRCKKGDFLDLFPFELRMLIAFLQIQPFFYREEFIDSDFTKTNVLNTMTSFILLDRRVGGALLAYYPEWLPRILEFSKQNNIFELIPRKKDIQTKEAYLKFILQSVV